MSRTKTPENTKKTFICCILLTSLSAILFVLLCMNDNQALLSRLAYFSKFAHLSNTTEKNNSANHSTGSSDQYIYTTQVPSNVPKLLVYGVITVAEKYDIRMIIRSSYAFQKAWQYGVLLRFIIGIPRENVTLHMAQMNKENATYGDIVVLNMKENMNRGKTYAYFQHVYQQRELFGDFKFIGKYDDDTVIKFSEYAEVVSSFKHEQDVFFGFCLHLQRKKPVHNMSDYRFDVWRNNSGHGRLPMYIAGLGYGFSYDILQWINSNKSFAFTHRIIRGEDATTTQWLVHDKRGSNLHCFERYEHNYTLFVKHGSKKYWMWSKVMNENFIGFQPFANQSFAVTQV